MDFRLSCELVDDFDSSIGAKEESKTKEKSKASLPTLPITIDYDGCRVWIRANGFGEHDAEIGEGWPVMLEFYDGEWVIWVRPDIKEEDPVKIDMREAREEKRKTETA